jgi:signal transduction histidine kinase
MGVRYQIFHDLGNTFGMLKGHIEEMLESSEGRVPDSRKTSRPATIRMGLERIDSLIHQYLETEDAPGQALGTMDLEIWIHHVQEILLPTFTTLYQLDIQLQTRMENDVSIVIKPMHFQTMCDNLIANAAAAGATRIQIEIREESHCINVTIRDNGSGMTPEQLNCLGLGFSTKGNAGHGRGFRIVYQLAADMGAIVRPPKSIVDFGTEVTLSFMKVGAGARLLAT